MKSKLFYIGMLAIASTVGCNQGDSTVQSSIEPEASISMDMPPPATVEVHEHPSEGPHHGSLIELGKEEFHAELVHDDQSVTIYVLDSAAKSSIPIDASELWINLLMDGKPTQFRLAAAPDGNDPSGKSSRFVSTDSALASQLDKEAAAPKLSLSINGKSYRGIINHSHSHDLGHGH
jgi:hypothetical protein